MYVIDSDSTTGLIKISDEYPLASAPEFSAIGDKYIVSFVHLQLVEKFKTFAYNTYGTSLTRYLNTYFRVSRDTNAWTEWLPLTEDITNFPPFDPKDSMYLEIKWERAGTNATGVIKLTDYEINGVIATDKFDGERPIKMTASRNSMVIKPPFIFKVFKINDLEILSDGDSTNFNFKYRFSQDYGRTVSDWEPLTKENITTVRINPVRFFQIEYLVTYTGMSNATLLDINLIGDFQNVTLDSQKTNVYGIRENCNCLKLGLINDPNTAPTTESNLSSANTGILTVDNCNLDQINKPLSPEDIQLLFKPYQQNQAVKLLNKLSTDSNEMFGHEVVYFLTDPDKKGIDYTFHEYQLYNYVCSDLIKVSVDGNNFPDSQIAFNQFDLSLFESFEIHIPKDSFKSKFGVEKRPSKEDFLWFCELNRMFQVEHAQQFRNFNNSAVYWKIMLKKYVQKANVIGANQTIADKVKELTKNTTIDELFGIENTLDKKDVANKEQLRPLTQDKLRVDINADINRELIMNSTTIVSKNNYDLAMVNYQSDAVIYRNFRNYFQVSDNFSFFIWFNINNYTVNDNYSFIDYYDTTNSKGFKVNLNNDTTIFTLNGASYSMTMTPAAGQEALYESVWYTYLVNVDQRKRSISQYIYKRNVDEESNAELSNSTVLRKLYTNTQTLTPVEFELESNVKMKIIGSDMKVTNIRMFNDVIPESEHNKLLNQYLIGEDYKNLIFADNANKRLILPYLEQSQIDKNLIRTENRKESL